MSNNSKVDMATALNWALDDAMAQDDNVFLLGEEVGDKQGGGIMQVSKGLSTKYGEQRIRTTPISETAFSGAAVGAAITGMRPVCEIMLMNFLTVCMDQVVNHAAKLRFMSGGQTHVPMTIRCMTGSGFGVGGQHSDYLEAWFCHVPGMKVVIPSNPADGYGLLLSAIFDEDPVLFVENTGRYGIKGDAPTRGERIPLGKARIVREGGDATVIGYGPLAMETILLTVDQLAEDDINVEVIDLRTVSPLDMDTILTSVRKTGRAVVAHEAVKAFGTGAEIASRIHESLFHELKAPVERLGSKESPVPFSKVLEQAYVFNQEDLSNAIRRTLK